MKVSSGMSSFLVSPKNWVTVAMLSICLSVQADTSPSTDADTELEHRLDEILSTLAEQTMDDGYTLPGSAVLHIENLQGALIYEGAKGTAYYAKQAPMTTAHQFIISSITKAMVATVILQLWEEGHFGKKGLDSNLDEVRLFSDELLEILQVYEGVSYGRQITLRQLLTHRSGLGTGWANLGGEVNVTRLSDMFKVHFLCTGNPDCDTSTLRTSKQWARWQPLRPLDSEAGLVNSYLTAQLEKPQSTAVPGIKYEYRDINFWMLAVLAQNITGKPLYRILRERIFNPLGMENTYMMYTGDTEEDRHAHEPSDYYVDRYPGFSSGLNFSMDWAGGGIATTADELATFLRALLTRQLYNNPATFSEMIQWHEEPDADENVVDYVGLGFFKTEFFDTSVLGHTGFVSAFMFYEPSGELIYTGTFNRTSGDFYKKMAEIIHNVHEYQKSTAALY